MALHAASIHTIDRKVPWGQRVRAKGHAQFVFGQRLLNVWFPGNGLVTGNRGGSNHQSGGPRYRAKIEGRKYHPGLIQIGALSVLGSFILLYPQFCKYRIETEGEVTTANSTRGRQPKGSVCHSSRPVVSI